MTKMNENPGIGAAHWNSEHQKTSAIVCIARLQENATLLVSFPHVCPEPVWVKYEF
jgi:hypothetical protein